MISGIRFVGAATSLKLQEIKDIAFQLRQAESNLVMVLTTMADQKAGLAVFVSDDLVREKKMDASVLVKSLAPMIQGGGGGQAFFATAGGKITDALPATIEKARELIREH